MYILYIHIFLIIVKDEDTNFRYTNRMKRKRLTNIREAVKKKSK